ncbi:MAG TPA: DUF4255 domain-containing protein [Chryseolinea sp.]|nr:DUF4255 domain-containing protein [Chryseolinea sp.]
MIYPSLNTIAEKLNSSIFEKWGATVNGTNEIVQLNNIASVADEKTDLYNRIILTLLKVEEETSLKNAEIFTRKTTGRIEKHQPPVYLNLYLLVAVTKKNYKEALQLLSDTITFFQYNKVFTGEVDTSPEHKATFRITVELHETNFQDVFDMWSNLGSKQFPSVIYKVRLLTFFDATRVEDVPVVKTVNIEHQNIGVQ